MGKVAKQVVAKQKSDQERTAKLIGDLVWYVNEMNKCIQGLVDSANELNAIVKESVDAYKEG